MSVQTPHIPQTNSKGPCGPQILWLDEESISPPSGFSEGLQTSAEPPCSNLLGPWLWAARWTAKVEPLNAIHKCNKCLLVTYNVPGMVLDIGVHRRTAWTCPCPWGDGRANRKSGAHTEALPTQCWCMNKVLPESSGSDVT